MKINRWVYFQNLVSQKTRRNLHRDQKSEKEKELAREKIIGSNKHLQLIRFSKYQWSRHRFKMFVILSGKPIFF